MINEYLLGIGKPPFFIGNKSGAILGFDDALVTDVRILYSTLWSRCQIIMTVEKSTKRSLARHRLARSGQILPDLTPDKVRSRSEIRLQKSSVRRKINYFNSIILKSLRPALSPSVESNDLTIFAINAAFMQM